MNGLGSKQQRMLLNMRYHGDGGWPPSWKIRFDDRAVLASLAARQLISTPSEEARLTSAGFLVAASLAGDL